jgi:hypothetical protein
MSGLPPKADIAERDRNVRFVPKADICTLQQITGCLGQMLTDFAKSSRGLNGLGT